MITAPKRTPARIAADVSHAAGDGVEIWTDHRTLLWAPQEGSTPWVGATPKRPAPPPKVLLDQIIGPAMREVSRNPCGLAFQGSSFLRLVQCAEPLGRCLWDLHRGQLVPGPTCDISVQSPALRQITEDRDARVYWDLACEAIKHCRATRKSPIWAQWIRSMGCLYVYGEQSGYPGRGALVMGVRP